MDFLKDLLALFTRFTVAHERLAEANALIAQGMVAGVLNAAASSAPQPFTPVEPESGPVETPAPGPAAEKAEWDPYTAPQQGRYGKALTAILDRELAARGITLKPSATGAEKHQALRDAASKPQPEPTMEQPSNPFDQAPAPAPAEQPKVHTVDEVRQALKQLTVALGADAGVKRAYAILAEAGGGAKQISEVKPELYPAVMAAVKRGLEGAA